jgi:glycosyltransferase involved in cell wall biosynthesis
MDNHEEMKKELHSIVVPVYQSRNILESMVTRVSEVMIGAGINFEMVLVDDGSRDGSFAEIRRLSDKFAFVRGFRLSRNFGHQAALTIGLAESRGSFVAIIDDDLQDPPEVLPGFFEALYNGSDVVYGVRRKRKEGILKRFLYSSFYKVLNMLASVHIPMDAGDFCVMKRCVVDAMLQLRDANPFLRGVRAWIGFEQIGMEYERSARFEGQSGYSFRKYINLAITGLIMFSYIPLRVATYLGLFVAAVSALYVVGITTWWFFKPFDVPGYLSLVVIITFMGGVQLICLGVIGEYIARLNDNSRRWPIAIVAETTSRDTL